MLLTASWSKGMNIFANTFVGLLISVLYLVTSTRNAVIKDAMPKKLVKTRVLVVMLYVSTYIFIAFNITLYLSLSIDNQCKPIQTSIA